MQALNQIIPKDFLRFWSYFVATIFISLTTGANLSLATLASDIFKWPTAYFSTLFVLASFAGILMALLLPKFLKKYPLMTSPITLVTLAVISYLPLSYVPENYLFWLIAFFVRAFAGNALYFMVEASFVPLLKPSQRARGITLYFMCSVFGFMLAPLIYAEVGFSSLSIVGAPMAFVVVLLLLHKRLNLKEQIVESPRLSDFIPLLQAYPVLWMICFVGGMASESVDAFLGVMALDLEYTQKESLQLMSWFFLGGIVLQYPLSLLMDKSHRMRYTIRLISFIALWSFVVAISAQYGYLAFALSLSVWGGICYVLAVASLALVGDKFSGQQRILAVALQSALYHAGCLLGPVFLGFGLSAVGGSGVPLTFAIICMTLLLIRKVMPRKKGKALDVKPIWGLSLPLLVELKQQSETAYVAPTNKKSTKKHA